MNRQFQEAATTYQKCPCQENLSALNVLKEKLEHLCDKSWKYFLNLEKRNHVRKHIRKLCQSGIISTDPFEILEAERVFYENLYKSRRDGSEVNKPNFNFEDLPIPTLSNDSSDLGEGLISIEECKKVLNSFPLNKVSGNDGLSIEFYKTFWDLIGDPLVASLMNLLVKER